MAFQLARHKKDVLLKAIGILLILTVSIHSQSIFQGKTIRSNETWKGTVIIQGDIVVAPGARLMIEPGTRVLFEPNRDDAAGGADKTRAELIVKGLLIARGKIDNKITFSVNTAEPRMGQWYGIQIINPNTNSILDFTIIEYAYNGISLKKSSPQISNSQIRFNYNTGILAEVKAHPTLLKNVISENGYAGVICNLGAKPVLTENLITLNQIGIIIFRLSQPNLGSIIRNDDYNAGENRIFENRDYNIYNHSNLAVKAENNSWGVFNRDEVEVTLFDAKNDPQYGAIDFEPFIRVRSDLNDFMVIVQDPALTGRPRQTLPDTITEQVEAAPGNLATGTVLPEGAGLEVDTQQVETPDSILSEFASLNFPPDQAEEESAAAVQIDPLQVSQPASRQEQEKVNNQPAQTVRKEPEVDYNQIFLEPFLDDKKVIIKKVAPQIGNERWGLRAEGIVHVRVVVGKDGLVENAQVLRGVNPYYDRIAREAAEQFRFKPGTVNARVVRFYTNLFFEF